MSKRLWVHVNCELREEWGASKPKYIESQIKNERKVNTYKYSFIEIILKLI